MYYSDYESEPIGGSNPYYRCKCCKISDPQINGELKNHATWCDYRIKKELELDLIELRRLAEIGKKYEHFEESTFYCIRCERPVMKGKKYCTHCFEYEKKIEGE